MIIKNANDYQNLISTIEIYVKDSMESPGADKDDSVRDVINGVVTLIGKLNKKNSIENDDILRLLGAEDKSKVGTLLGDVRKYLESSDVVGYAKLLLGVANLYRGYASDSLKGPLEDSISKIKSIVPDISEGTVGEVIFKEEPSDLSGTETTPEKNLSSFYVSEENEFSISSIFYGPFDSVLKATIFSALIHDYGFEEELSIMSGDGLSKLHKYNRTNNFNLGQARDTGSASIKNQKLKGRIERAAAEKKKGGILELSTSRDVFNTFVEFLSQYFIEDFSEENISLKGLKKWTDSGVQTGSTSKVPEVKAPSPKLNQVFPSKGDLEITVAPPAIEISNALKSVESFQQSITSKDNVDILSNSSITEFFNKIKSEIILFDKIEKHKRDDASLDGLGALFASIAKKDLEIKGALREFREKNKLNLHTEMDYEWEFRNGFSILDKIVSDSEVINSLVSIIGELVVNRLATSEEKKLKFRVSRTVKGYVANQGIKAESATDIDNAISEVEIRVMQDVRRIVEMEIRKNVGIFIGSSGFFNQDVSAFADKILGLGINVSSIINLKTQEFFSNKDRILSSQKFYMARCGVCSQMTQVPQKYKKLIDSFSSEIKQYSFFRKDGSPITESELIGTDSVRMYNLSPNASDILSDYLKKSSRKSAEGLVSKQYTWEEVNLMISDPSSSGANSAKSVEQNIIGLIIRNDILNYHFDAMQSGRRGIFANKSLCAGSLFDLSDDIKAFKPTQKFLAEQQNFECKATVASSYDLPSDSPKYFKSAYVSANGNIAGRKEVDSYFNTGFRFSKNQVRCPCHIDSNSDTLRIVKEKKGYKEVFDTIAIPNIPSSVVSSISDKLDKFGVNKDSIYYPPTTPDGGLAENIPEAGYVVCGKRVSLSLFDKDPSSPNYIRSVLSNVLSSKGGTKTLVSIVNLLISYGVEMNDLRPHVEAVMSSGLMTTSAKRKTLKELFSQSKISIAEDLSPEGSALILRDVGLTCEHGHKFTIGQSWDFAKTHFAIIPQGRVKTERISGLISNRISITNIVELAQSDSAKAMKLMMTGPSEGNPGFGVFKKESEEILRERGYRQPGDVESYEELLSLIKNKKLYYKSDGLAYIISDDLPYGALVSSPWKSDSITLSPQSTYNINLYAGSMESLSKNPEEGGETDVADTSLDDYEDYEEEEEESEKSNFLKNTHLDLKFANILFPDIGAEIRDLEILSKEILSERLDQENSKREEDHQSLSNSFISKLITAMRLSRTWAIMAADSQIDFLKKPSAVPFSSIREEEEYKKLKLTEQALYFENRVQEKKGDLKEKIENTLRRLLESIGKTSSSTETESFFREYDILGLIERSVSQDKFMSLAGIAQYYRGFSTPFVANLSNEKAQAAILKSLEVALRNNLPSILGIDDKGLDSSTSSEIEKSSKILAEYLISPYEMSAYSVLAEKAVVDYSGRALIFSFSLDLINKMRDFFSKFLFNKESVLYIGPYGNEATDVLKIMEDLLGIDTINGTSAPRIIQMEDSEFNEKINEMKSEFEGIYNPERLFLNYMGAKGIKVADPGEVSPEDFNDTFKMNILQRAVVLSRFSKSLSIARESIDYIIMEWEGKPMGSPSIKKSAKILDGVVESLMKQRDPEGFAENKTRITESRKIYGKEGSLFSTNAVGVARINLSPANEALAPIESEDFSFKAYRASEKILTGVSKDLKIDLKLVCLREILVKSKDINRENTKIYISLVPLSTDVRYNMVLKKIDILNNNEGISLNTDIVKRADSPQIKEFVSRYLSGVSGVDYSRVIIVDSSYKVGSFERITDSVLTKISESNSRFEIKISRIGTSSKVWPPPTNLLFDSNNMLENVEYSKTENQQDIARVDSVNNYYEKSSYSPDHNKFMSNIDNFLVSVSSQSPETSGSFGMIIPLKSEGRYNTYNAIANTSGANSNTLKDVVSVSESKIYIRSESGKKINISWAFKSLDPQFINEDGNLRHKLVQSGVVQKMNHIQRNMDSIYQWIISNSQLFFEKISKINSGQGISLSNNEVFFETFFSPLSPVVRISPDIEARSSRASLNMDNINLALSRMEYGEYNFSKENLLSNLATLTDYYNASQILNSKYLELQPTLVLANSVKVGAESYSGESSGGKSLAISLLDPYSLWAIVSNPAMRKRFGGPIDQDDIDDYKSFIIQTFGLDDIVSGVINKTGIKASSFKVADLFDLVGFYNRSYKESGNQADPSLVQFAKLFNLSVDYDEDKFGLAKTYINGYPICTKPPAGLKEIVESAGSCNFVVDSSSYIEHPYRLEQALASITDSTIKEFMKKLNKSLESNTALLEKLRADILDEKQDLDTPSLKERLERELSETRNSRLLTDAKKKSKIKEIEKKYESEIEDLLSQKLDAIRSEELLKQDFVINALQMNEDLESGKITLDMDALHSMATGYRSRGAKRSKYYDLGRETARIISNLFRRETKATFNLISWRKIAQTATDNQGTMIRSLYHEWWEQYLNVMAKLASQE
jgi:hypothetical protein